MKSHHDKPSTWVWPHPKRQLQPNSCLCAFQPTQFQFEQALHRLAWVHYQSCICMARWQGSAAVELKPQHQVCAKQPRQAVQQTQFWQSGGKVQHPQVSWEWYQSSQAQFVSGGGFGKWLCHAIEKFHPALATLQGQCQLVWEAWSIACLSLCPQRMHFCGRQQLWPTQQVRQT